MGVVKAVKSLGGLVHFTGGLLRIESSVSNSKLPHRIVGVGQATSFNPRPFLIVGDLAAKPRPDLARNIGSASVNACRCRALHLSILG